MCHTVCFCPEHETRVPDRKSLSHLGDVQPHILVLLAGLGQNFAPYSRFSAKSEAGKRRGRPIKSW